MNCEFSAYLATLVAVLICGCAPTISVVSQLNSVDMIDLERVYVVIDTPELDDNTRTIVSPRTEFSTEPGSAVADTINFSSRFLAELSESFNALNVECQFHNTNGFESTEDEISVQAAQFRADAVLWINEERVDLRSNEFAESVPYDEIVGFALIAYIFNEYPGDKYVWRASIRAEKNWLGEWIPLAKISASTLVDRFVTDRLID